MSFINFNGQIVDSNEAIYTANNRLRFGDGFFESMRVFNQKIAFAEKHQQRISKNVEMLKMELTSFNLVNEVKQTLDANNIVCGRVRIQFFREGSGRYLPNSNLCSFAIEAENDGIKNYTLSILENVGVSEKFFKSCHEIGNIKSSNALLYVLASLDAREKGWNEAIILNENGNVCEALSSNVFIVTQDGVVLTPTLSSGCVGGVMREVVIELLKTNNITANEADYNLETLKNAQEIFFTNASKGIQSLACFQQQAKQTQMAEALCSLLNSAIN